MVSGFCHLQLDQCDLRSMKQILEFRTFDSIEIGGFMTGRLNSISIEAKVLEFRGIRLEEILGCESIETGYLSTTYSDEDFSENLLSMIVG